MPTRDGTGPIGFWPATGRGLGPCGRGFGWKNWGKVLDCKTGPAELSKEERVKILKAEKDSIEQALKELGE